MLVNNIFNNAYQGKRVLVTGDTGFKGSWISIWLTLLGADVIGYSSYLPSKPCLFSVCNVDKLITHIDGDIRDTIALNKAFKKYKPEFVFHLAAQPIVRRAFSDPVLTMQTNVMGTVNILECMRKFSKEVTAVIITSDKCYSNMEWDWGYRETDPLGGNDPYSSSKACAELICHAYFKSYFSGLGKRSKMATARAGNVVGGGDWAEDRIVPDCVRAWSRNDIVTVRNPKATRPWQHVLEPLSGYLWIGAILKKRSHLNGQSFNFGPDYKVRESVGELIHIFSKYFSGRNKWRYADKRSVSKESMFLRVSCDKALKYLDWYGVLSFTDTIKLTAEWYDAYYRANNSDMLNFTRDQINYYVDKARKNMLTWAKE